MSSFPKGFYKKYSLLGKQLGKGGYATVILGKDNVTGAAVAVKIQEKKGVTSVAEKKLEKEVNILLKIKHQNVVRVFGAFNEPNEYMIVMEYVEGGTLENPYGFTEAQSKNYLLQVAAGLQHCKNQGVIHRDLKPANILVTKEGAIKVADFNLSKVVTPNEAELTMLNTVCGTPHFIAPEIIIGNKPDNKTPYSYKCDIWSFGVLAFFLFSQGHLPFSPEKNIKAVEHQKSLLGNVMKGEYSFSPEDKWKDISEQSKDLVRNCLQKEPSKRFTYEQVIGHPCFKMKTAVAMTEKDLRRQKVLATAKATQAAQTLGSLMGQNEGNDREVMPSGSMLFDFSLSELNLT